MYRYFLPLLILGAAYPAPQDLDSNITYLKIQPLVNDNVDKAPSTHSPIMPPTGSLLPLSKPNSTETTTRIEGPTPRYSSTYGLTDATTIKYQDVPETSTLKVDVYSDGDPSMPRDFSEAVEVTTRKHEFRDSIGQASETRETRRTAISPRHLTKLSYAEKDDPDTVGVAINMLEKSSKRNFKSKCRCEKIWNCPKLQITVPRCPDEYFMCCF